MNSLIIDGNAVYEIDEECIRRKERQGIGQRSGPQTAADMRQKQPGSADTEPARQSGRNE